MELQVAFDAVLAYMRQQKRKSAADGRCMYRNPDGTKCAIGCLIPDHLYDPEFENKCIEQLPELALNLGLPIGFAARLQSAHDSSDDTSFMTVFEDKMATLARRYNLTYST
jgi:hypothetical protein